MKQRFTAFLDETQNKHIFGVSGVLFDPSGIEAFELKRRKYAEDLVAPFHATDCYRGTEQFAGWPRRSRSKRLEQVANVIGRTYLAGFLVYIEREEYDQWRTQPHGLEKVIGGAYTACLLTCIEMISTFVKREFDEGGVLYVPEAGHRHHVDADRMLSRIAQNDLWRQGLRYAGHEFRGKSELMLEAADLVAWTWQRNYREMIEDEQRGDVRRWSRELQTLIRANPRILFLRELNGNHLSVRGLINRFHGFHRD